MDRLALIVDEVERRLKWKRDKTTVGITIPFYVTKQEIETLSCVYIIARDPFERTNFKRRKGRKPFIKDNEIWIRRTHGNKKRKNRKFLR